MEKTLLEHSLNKLREIFPYSHLQELNPEINARLNPKYNPEINPEYNLRLNRINPLHQEEEIRILNQYLPNYMNIIEEKGWIEEYFSLSTD